jgi:uncharacterized membrane protein YfcA
LASSSCGSELVSTTTIVLGISLGLAAGVLAGMFGVGGGILFVPTLLAILPTVTAGALNQRRYGHLRARTALVVGIASIVGVEIGARIATSLPETGLRRLFAVLLFAVAVQLVWRARRNARARYPESP